MSGLAGAAVWAVVPFTPQAPFRLYAGTEQAPITVPDARTIIRATRKGGDTQFDYLVPATVRPVLVLTDAHDDDLGEYLALRLARFAKLTEQEQQRVRDGQHRSLFHLRPDRFSLPEENAAMVAAPVRVHRTAVDLDACGRLDDYELRTLQERFILFHGFDMRGLLKAARAQMPSAGPPGASSRGRFTTTHGHSSTAADIDRTG